MPRKYTHSPLFTPKRVTLLCPTCGISFETQPSRARTFCSHECSAKPRADAGRVERACAQCGASFTIIRAWLNKHPNAGTYCSRICAGAARTAAATERRESIPPRRTCSECGVAISGRRRLTCSTECAMARARAQTIRLNKEKTAHKSYERICPECGVTFDPPYGHRARKFCCQGCTDRHHRRTAKAQRRARRRALPYEKLNPIVVLARAKWHCAMCGIATPRSLRGTHEPNAPELDHIVPLARGGHHVWDNVQCLCRACNIKKSDSL